MKVGRETSKGRERRRRQHGSTQVEPAFRLIMVQQAGVLEATELDLWLKFLHSR